MKTKRFLSILLSLVLVLGMLPGMSLTASAADNTTEITPTNTSGNMTITLKIKAAQTITASDVTATYGDTDKAVSASVTEPTTGGGAITYAVKDGSGDYIDVAADGKLTIKKVPASGKAYVIVKAAETDDYAETTREVTVTISKADPTAPTGLTATYGQTLADVALPTGWTWADSTQSVGSVVSPAATFKANFAGNDNYNAASNVDVTVTVGKADPTAPTGLTATYGQTLANVTLPDGWAWADSTQSVGSVVSPAATFKANFAGDDNYNPASDVDVAVTVSKANNPATVNGTASVKKGGNELDLQGNVKLNGATGEVSYAISGETLGCTLSGSKLTSGNTEGSVTVNVTVAADDNYYASAPMPITVTITKKDTQTITAEDVTATYGDTGVKVAATTDGDGQISYAVKDGSGEYIGIMKDTGVLTLIKAGTGTVVVTASETSTYAQATKEVTVTINKAASNPAKVTANNRTYDGKKKDLLTVEGEASGGTMMYALGSETAPGAEYSEDIPAAADIGTYYVWYKVVGDENHEDTEPAYVTAKIEARQFTITYDLNGGKLDGETGKVTKTAKEGEVITLPAPTRDGYTFDYWEGSRYNAGDKYTVTEDHSFKAVWKTADSGKDGSGKSSGKKGAKTGDENTLAAWIVLLMAALTGTGGIVYAKKRRND